MNNFGRLFIVSTPIGNMQDITIRAIQTLFEVEVIACEDRIAATRLLFYIKNKYLTPLLEKRVISLSSERISTSPKLITMNEFEEEMKIPEILDFLLAGKSVAYISEAGTPLLSDPGFKLVRSARKKGISVITIPGASAISAALSIAGLPTDKFFFVGFPPKGEGRKKTFFENIHSSLDALSQKNLTPTLVFFESPHRIQDTFETIRTLFGDIEITIARELTKIHEETVSKTVSEFLTQWENYAPKGEFVILLHK